MTWFSDWAGENSSAIWTVVVGAAGNVSCALLGCYLVLRRLSLLGDAISHSILPGIAVAFVLAGRGPWALFLGAMACGLLTAVLTQALQSSGKIAEDASMGVVFTSLFALGVILINVVARKIDLDPGCVLYGLIEFAPLDTIEIAGWEIPRAMQSLTLALAGVLLCVTLFWKELKIVSFDPQLATSMGISATFFHYLLMTLVAGVSVANFETVGSILVIAMLIVPAATAHLLTDRLGWMMVWSAAIGVTSSILGYWTAARLNTSVAAMMAVAAGGQFLLAVLLAPRHGALARAWHTFSLGMRIEREDVLAMLYRKQEHAARQLPQLRQGWRSWLAKRQLVVRGEVSDTSGALSLTDRGRQTAESLVRAHRLWEAYLGENFELPLDHLHEPAERVEHFLGPELQAQLAAELQQRAQDPHGREIPGV